MSQLPIFLLLGGPLLLVSAKGSHLISKLEIVLTSTLLFAHVHGITKSVSTLLQKSLAKSPFLLHAPNHCL